MERSEIKKFFKQCQETDKYFDLLVDSAIGEVHHILPESIYPEFAKCDWNLVKISFENHYKVHELLPFIVLPEHKKPMAYAWKMMCGRTKGEFVDCDRYAELAIMRSSLGYPASDEQKRKQSETMKGRPSPLKGKERPNLKGKMAGEKNPMARSVIIDGVEYATLTEAAEKFGVTKQAIVYWVKIGKAYYSTEAAPSSWSDGRERTVIVDGVEYKTMSEACAVLGVTSTTIRNWSKKGKASIVKNKVGYARKCVDKPNNSK